MPARKLYFSQKSRRQHHRQRRKNTARRAKSMNKVAKGQVLSLRETKIKNIPNVAGIASWNNTNKWLSFQPLNLDMTSSNSETDRENSMVYALNYRLKCHIEPHPDYISPFYLRFVMGYAKGSNNYGETQQYTQPSLMVQSSALNGKLPNHFSDFDKDDWKIISDKLVRITPRQIYDTTSGTSVGEETGVSDDNGALWGAVKKTFNFKFNRKYRFEGAGGSSLVGWYPFCAIQLDRTAYGGAFTGASGSHPSPLLTYESDLYFKEIP